LRHPLPLIMTERKRILFRGVPMIEGWPEKIFAAQQISTYTLEGRSVQRIPYGDEETDWGTDRQACHDCRVIKGEFHVPSCDVEECPVCGGQLITCDCPFDEDRQDPAIPA
jgi:hypothetical protein